MPSPAPTPAPTPLNTDYIEDICSAPFGTFACLNLSGSSPYLILILIGLILTVNTIDYAKYSIQHAMSTSTFWTSFYHSLESELTSLGLLSFSLFLFSQALGSAGRDEENELREIVELTEFMHIILFLSCATYIFFIAMSGREAQRYLKSWRQATSPKAVAALKLFMAGEEIETVPPVGPLWRICRVFWCWGWLLYRNFSNKDLEDDLLAQVELNDPPPSLDDPTHPPVSDVQLIHSIFLLTLRAIPPPFPGLPPHSPKSLGKAFLGTLGLKSTTTKHHIDVFQTVTAFLIRDAFLRIHDLPRDLPFNYIDYSSSCCTAMFCKICHLGWRLWSLFLVSLVAISAVIEVYYVGTGTEREDIDKAFNSDPNNNKFQMRVMTLGGWILIMTVSWSFKSNQTTLIKLLQIAVGAPRSSIGDPLLPSEERAPSSTAIKGRSLGATMCPCFSKEVKRDPYRQCFFGSAPDWYLRHYQATVFFYGLFISLFVTMFIHVDGWLASSATTLLLPFFIMGGFGFSSPKYIAIRYFGTSLVKQEIFERCVTEAWEKYKAGERSWDLDCEEDVKTVDDMFAVLTGEGES